MNQVKIMKKLLSFLLLIALASGLAACAAPTVDNAPQSTPTPVPSVNLADREVESYGSLPGEILLEELMADFAVKIQAGSAGSSLKAVGQACRLMDWGMDTSMTEEEIFAAVDFFLSGLDEAAHAEYITQLQLLDATYQQLLLPGQEALLETAGCADSRYPWTDMPIRCVESFFTAVGLRDTYQFAADHSPAAPAIDPLYADYLSDCYHALLENWEYDYMALQGLNAVIFQDFLSQQAYSGISALEALGYCLHDVNADGIQELLIGKTGAPKEIFNIISIADGNLIMPFEGWERNLCFICADGTVVTRGSGGAAITYYTYYKFDGAALNVFGSVIHEGNASPDAPWFISTDDDKDIMNDSPASEAQALGLIQQYENQYISFDLKPLSKAGDL